MKIWSDVEYVYRCLADLERTSAFESAIRAVVKPGDVVLDLGTGSGIMAIFAARAGARRVYAVEIGPHLNRISRAAFDVSGFGSTIVSLRADARQITRDDVGEPDVVICEMITTGLIGEMQGPVLNTLKRVGVIGPETVLVPDGLSTGVSLVAADFTYFGVELKVPVFVDYFSKSFDRRPEIFSEKKAGHRVNFYENFSEHVTISQEICVLRAGTVNGLLLESVTNFPDGSTLGTCISFCQPVILPVTPTPVSPGDRLAVSLEYVMGEGFDSLKYNVRRMD